MIRGLVPKERLLEWSAEDGWEPLCKFLGKEVPGIPFPHVNTKSKGWKDREAQCLEQLFKGAIRNLAILSTLGVGGAGWFMYRRYLL